MKYQNQSEMSFFICVLLVSSCISLNLRLSLQTAQIQIDRLSTSKKGGENRKIIYFNLAIVYALEAHTDSSKSIGISR